MKTTYHNEKVDREVFLDSSVVKKTDTTVCLQQAGDNTPPFLVYIGSKVRLVRVVRRTGLIVHRGGTTKRGVWRVRVVSDNQYRFL